MTRVLPFKSVMTTAAAFAALCTGAGVANADGFSQTNLVSDMPGLATIIDSSLVNPGVSRSRTGESGFRTRAQNYGPALSGDG